MQVDTDSHREVALPFLHIYDLLGMGLLSGTWEKELHEVARLAAKEAFFDGSSPTSFEEHGSRIEYRLVDGDELYGYTPWLFGLYAYKLRELASWAAGQPVVPSMSIRSAINLNVQAAGHHRYERHVDTNPVTGLLFATTHDRANGGCLIFECDEIHVSIAPIAGRFLVFDGRRCLHYVEPVNEENNKVRISAPMNFYTQEVREEHRSTRLDKYLYTV